MPLTTVLTAAGGAGASRLLVKPFADLYGAAKDEVKSLVRKWNMAGQRDQIVQKISEVEKVRTITGSGLTPLSEFYYPSKIIIAKSRTKHETVEVNSLRDISRSKNTLICGTVGQGKSIFLRFLCVAELKLGERIPIFVELRSIDDRTTLEDLIIYKFRLLGLGDVTPDVFHFFLNHGSFVFFLDGFDEVKREYALKTQNALRLLMAQYPATQWVISSRPGSLGDHLSTIPSLLDARLAPLSTDDFDPFFTALGVDGEMRGKLITAIKAS